MSTLNTTNIKHPSSASNNIVLDSSGNVVLQAGSASTPALQPSGDPNTGIFFPAADTIAFAEGGAEAARIDSSGRLLVGASSSVGGEAIQSHNTAGDNLAVGRFAASAGSGDIAFYKSRSGTVGTNTVVNAQDSLGLLSWKGADGTSYVRAATIEAYVDGTPGTNDMPGRLVFSTTADGASSPTERMRIRANGNTSMGGGLAIGSNGIDTSYFYIGNLQSGAGNSTLKWNTSTGYVTYDTSSRLVKTNIEDCPYGLAELAQLKPRKYFRTDDQKIEIGFVADEVVDVLPEFVPIGPKSIITKNETDTEEIPLGVNYEKLTAVLTKALQEAIDEIESLKARVAALEAA